MSTLESQVGAIDGLENSGGVAPTADLTVNSLTATSFVETPQLQSAAGDLHIQNALVSAPFSGRYCRKTLSPSGTKTSPSKCAAKTLPKSTALSVAVGGAGSPSSCGGAACSVESPRALCAVQRHRTGDSKPPLVPPTPPLGTAPWGALIATLTIGSKFKASTILLLKAQDLRRLGNRRDHAVEEPALELEVDRRHRSFPGGSACR